MNQADKRPAGIDELVEVFHSTRLIDTRTALISYKAIGDALQYIRELEFQLDRANKQLREEKEASIHGSN